MGFWTGGPSPGDATAPALCRPTAGAFGKGPIACVCAPRAAQERERVGTWGGSGGQFMATVSAGLIPAPGS